MARMTPVTGFLRSCGKSRDRTPEFRVLQMEAEVNRSIEPEPRIQELLRWANRIAIGSNGCMCPTAKRALALSHAFGLAGRDEMGEIAIAIAESASGNRVSNLAGDLAYILRRGIATDNACDRTAHDQIWRELNRPDCIPARSSSDDSDRYTMRQQMEDWEFARASSRKRDVVLEACISNAIRGTSGLESMGVFSVDFDRLINWLRELKDRGRYSVIQPRDIAKLRTCWMEAVCLTSHRIGLSDPEWEGLAHYLKAVELILECEKVAVSVAPLVREKLLGRLLCHA